MQKHFRALWAIHGGFVALFMVLFFFPIYYVPYLIWRERSLRYQIWLSHRVFAPLLLLLIGVRVKTHGRQHIDPKETYIIVSNHTGNLDFMANAVSFPGLYRFLAKVELGSIPLFGFVVTKICILVDRSSRMSRAKSLIHIKQSLAKGYSVLIYPEGTRNRSEAALRPFEPGAVKMAILAGKPILVQTIANARARMDSRRHFDLSPGTLHCHWAAPIPTKGLSPDDADGLIAHIRQIMLQHIEGAKPEAELSPTEHRE